MKDHVRLTIDMPTNMHSAVKSKCAQSQISIRQLILNVIDLYVLSEPQVDKVEALKERTPKRRLKKLLSEEALSGEIK